MTSETTSETTSNDPLRRFAELFARAEKAIPKDPNAMLLATTDAQGRPSSRVVLLKDFDARGFAFYTNFNSRKGQELLARRWAALCFYWPPLDVQVRVEGAVETIAPEEADAYFASRPRGSQVGAWASQQSAPLASRAALETSAEEVEKRFEGKAVPRPPHWGGFRLVPSRIEFWHGRPDRLHERVLFTREGEHWRSALLNP
ncbi:MAG: pyridoxamine 5'-phosphate oxidase [Myxococcaceae bacterium]